MGDDINSRERAEVLEQPPEPLPTCPAVRFFDRTDWLSFGITTLLALAIYLATLAPSVELGFSGVYSTAAFHGGIPHPPGYPLWTMYAWVFVKLLPFSNIGWRVAVSSAVAGGLACGLIALMVSRSGAAIAGQMRARHGLTTRGEKWLRVVCGYSAGLVFACNGAFLGRAVIADAWPLSILLLCIVLSLFMVWIHRPERRGCLFGAVFSYGLGVTNTQSLLALAPAIPLLAALGDQRVGRDLFLAGGIALVAGLIGAGLGLLPSISGRFGRLGFVLILIMAFTVAMGIGLGLATRRWFSEWRTALVCCGAFLLGLMAWVYLPSVSMTTPPMNWAYPRTVEGFFHLVMRGQYEAPDATESVLKYLGQIALYFRVAGRAFGLIYLLIALVPFCFLGRLAASERRWMLGLAAAYVCLAFLLLAVLNPPRDMTGIDHVMQFFSPSYVVLAIWFGHGLTFLGTLLVKPAGTGTAQPAVT